MLTVVINKLQDDRDAHLPDVEFAYNNSVIIATGLAPDRVHIGRLHRLVLPVLNHSSVGGHNRLNRDQPTSCNLTVKRHERAYFLVREPHASTVRRAFMEAHDETSMEATTVCFHGNWSPSMQLSWKLAPESNTQLSYLLPRKEARGSWAHGSCAQLPCEVNADSHGMLYHMSNNVQVAPRIICFGEVLD